jgi:predicted phage-related endonuclease
MRQFNLPLNQAKLDTKVIQLKSIENQFNQLATKLKEVEERLKAKQTEVSELNDSITAYKQLSTTVIFNTKQ